MIKKALFSALNLSLLTTTVLSSELENDFEKNQPSSTVIVDQMVHLTQKYISKHIHLEEKKF